MEAEEATSPEGSDDPSASASQRTRLGLPLPSLQQHVGGARPQAVDLKITALLGRKSVRTGTAVRLVPGEQVPETPYRLIRWIGDGGMGIVYEAEHVALERRVAFKVLRPEATGSVHETRMFRQEARTVSKIGSDYIVEVFDLGELPDGRVWFAMELLEGRSLEQLIAEGPPDPGRAIGILRQVCKGLAAAHATGVIHRDVKPGNILLLTRRGRADAVKILDFGVSTLLSDVEQGAAIVAGTPSYVAPELACGLPYDARVDLYALGCTAYEIFAGHPPFTAKTIDDVLMMHVESQPPPLAEVARSKVPPPLAAVIMRCLAKHADDRYNDAEDLEAALCEAQVEAGLRTSWDDLQLPAVSPERRDRLLKRMPDPAQVDGHRNRGLAWAFGILGVAAVGMGAVWLGRDAEPELIDSAHLDRIETLTHEARAAAAKSYFVYPPASKPDEPTAYTKIMELETLEGKGALEAQTRAAELRQEFSSTLVRLGDRYWESDGGRPFAVDYYAAALMFDGTLTEARERVSLTPGELATIRQKAITQTFSPAELEATDALVALAEEDPEERLRKLEELEQDTERSATSGARLARLIDEEKPSRRRVRKETPTTPVAEQETAAEGQEADPAGDTEGTEAIEIDPNAPGPDGPSDAGPPKRQRDPQAARLLVEEGDAALKRGKVGEARRAYERALAADSRHAAAFDGLGRASFHSGDYAEAARLAEKAVRFAPRVGKYRINLGDAYYKAFRYGDAADEYKKAEELGHPAAASRLSKVKNKNG